MAEPTEAQARAVMGTKSAAIRREMPRLALQLPITGSAHKAAVVGDPAVAAVLAALDVAAQGCGATDLDGRHDLELTEAEVAGIGRPKGGAVAAEDVGDLERGAHRLNRRGRPRVCSLQA